MVLDLLDRLLSAVAGIDFFRDALRVLTGKPDRGPVGPSEPAPDVSDALMTRSSASHGDTGAGFAKVDLPDQSWGYQAPKPLPPARRFGWLVVGIGVAILLILAAYLANSEADLDPVDPGAAEVAFVLGPILAIAVAVVTGILLMLVAGLRLISVTVRRATRALAAGVILAPVIYLTLLVVGASALEAAHSRLLDAIVTFVLSTASGVAVTLAAVVIPRSRGL